MDAFISLKMKFLLPLCETDASVNSINFFIYQRQTSCFTDPVCPAGRGLFSCHVITDKNTSGQETHVQVRERPPVDV